MLGILGLVAGCTGGDPVETGPGTGCGDQTCALGENQGSCPADCHPVMDYDGSIDGCIGGVEQPDIDESVSIVDTTAGSYHEMVACGGLAMNLSSSLVLVVASAVAEVAEVQIPSGFTYAGDGQYVTGSNGTAMTVVYLLGGDYALGLEDDVVAYDLYDWANYLVGASVSVDPLSQEIRIAYSATGPLVELLGFGADPPNPLVVSASEVSTIGAPIGRLKMRASVAVTDLQDDATVDYTLVSDPRRLSPLLSDGGFDYEMLEARSLGATGVTFTSTDWGVGYNDAAGTLDGTITFQVRDGAVPLDGTFTYADSSYPTVRLSCGS